MKRRKHKGGLSLSLRLGRFLPRHFR
jgi:hypothetical protein